MPIEKTLGGTSHIDVLDRVLDKGIVIDAWVQVSLVGLDLITVEARVTVASIATYLQYSDALTQAGVASRPTLFEVAAERGLTEVLRSSSQRSAVPTTGRFPRGTHLL
jgi:ribosomal protein S12 methylthiotransferase accessory factor YcaO